jgi:phosphopantothenoylcysteine decarboxylase/phosphopantothenate--cysteine ligase
MPTPPRILLTAGPTREPIDPVRYLGNRSSGLMGAALARAFTDAGHAVTAILGPVEVEFPAGIRRIDIETAQEMHSAVHREWPAHELLIMAAAVADYRPRVRSLTKLSRSAGHISLDLEPTEDIAASACLARQPHQRVIGFSLEREGDTARAIHKMKTKGLDLIIFNPLATMGAPDVTPLLLYPDGRQVAIRHTTKADFARQLVSHALALFPTPQ